MLKRIIFGLLLMIFSVELVSAQSTSITSGVNWLIANQSTDYSWGNASTSTTQFTASAEALDALRLNGSMGMNFQNGLTWLNAQPLDSVNFASTRLLLRAKSALDFTEDLNLLISLRNNIDSNCGLDGEYSNDILNTALALQALKTANYPDQTIIVSALNYLTSTQNADGGWGFAEGDDSSVYVTALVSRTIQQFLQTTALATALNKATSYLLTKQNSAGGFGSPSSTVHETALAYNAIVAVITDATALGKAVGFLTNNQSADGSWFQDPYSTALALQALHYSEYRPTLPLPPTTGTLAGKVVSAATREPLAGVTVSLAGNPVIKATTDSAGAFKLDNIPQGSQQIILSLSGYAPSSLLTTVTAGGISNLGTLTLANVSSSGVIKGMIIDEVTGLPLAGVFITLYPPVGDPILAAVTSTNGTYRIEIAPEHYGIGASKEGYATIREAWTISAGDVIDFSPVLPTNTPPSTAGELMGRVVDDSTSAPVAGAVVTLVGIKNYTTSTNAGGYYHILNIDPFFVSTLKITASGYRDWYSTYTLLFFGGEINYHQGIQRLSPVQISTTITGKVTDSTTNLPIADAVVSVTGTAFTAKTDSSGSYTITGINLLNFEMKASASGHFDKSYVLSNQYHGAYTVDFDIVASPAVDTRIVSFNTDREVYKAYDDVAVVAAILNSGTVPATATVSVSVVNAQGEVIANLPFTEPDAGGTARNSITFQPGITKTVGLTWGTGSRPPGDYTVIVKIMAEASDTGLDSMVIAQQSKRVVIEPTQAIATISLTPLPRFTNLGATEQIGLQTTLINRSNVPTTVSLSYDWMSPDGAVLHTGNGTISAQPEEASKAVLLENFSYTFSDSGEHPLQVQVTSGPTPMNLIGGFVSVAPGIHIEPSQSLTPATVIPDGDKRIRFNIRLKGVVTK